mgnify:FL=1
MLLEGLIEAEDLDPCGRRHQGALGSPAVLVALVPANADVAQRLLNLGLPVSQPEHAGLQVLPSDALRERLERVGADAALGLTGHPPLRPETTVTARLYRQGDLSLGFLPAVLEEGTFFLSHDPCHFVDTVVNELHLLQRHWQGPGAPLLLIPVQAALLERSSNLLLELILSLIHI